MNQMYGFEGEVKSKYPLVMSFSSVSYFMIFIFLLLPTYVGLVINYINYMTNSAAEAAVPLVVLCKLYALLPTIHSILSTYLPELMLTSS